jgi:TatD DNase family protein
VYFGFSAVVNLRGGEEAGGNSRKEPKAAEAIRRVPADRLLVESDLVSPAEAEAGLREMLAFVAETRGWTLEEAARITRENAERFYGPVDESDAERV